MTQAASEGALVGEPDGTGDGSGLGAIVGKLNGNVVGAALGPRDGDAVGVTLGELDGELVGVTLGEPDGGVVGILLGLWEGAAEGSAEGAEVGINVGALVTEGTGDGLHAPSPKNSILTSETPKLSFSQSLLALDVTLMTSALEVCATTTSTSMKHVWIDQLSSGGEFEPTMHA